MSHNPFEQAEGPHPIIKVPDTLKAMQQIASFYRNKMSLPIIGITGSVGKTTTREMIAHVLKGKYRVFETVGNQNSQVGVPLTLDRLTSRDQIGVLELGVLFYLAISYFVGWPLGGWPNYANCPT